MSRCIDSFRRREGQRKLAFFLLALAATSPRAETSAGVRLEQTGSPGLLSERHWDGQRLSASPRRAWAVSSGRVYVAHAERGWKLEASRSRQAYVQSDTNTLAMVAQNARTGGIDLPADLSFDAAAKIQTLESTALALTAMLRPTQQLSVELTPHVYKVHAYQRIEGWARLDRDGSNARLRGQESRVGTRSYGFEPVDEPDSGYGWGVHAQVRYDGDAGVTKVAAQNLAGRLVFSNVHYAVKVYDIHALDGRLSPRETPAVQGRYGHAAIRNESLPIAWRVGHAFSALPGLEAGLTGLGGEVSGFAQYAIRWANGEVAFLAMDARNAGVALGFEPWRAVLLRVGAIWRPGQGASLSLLELGARF